MANLETLTLPDGSHHNFSMPAMTGASASTAGASGAVPAPSAGDEGKYLGGDGQWHTIAGAQMDTSITDGTTSQNAPTSQAVSQYVLGKGYLTEIIIPIDPVTTPTTDGAMWIETT